MPIAASRRPWRDEHPRHLGALRAERHADADLARALRHRVRDHAVDPGDAEQQRHRAGDRQHHQRERRPRHRLARTTSCSVRTLGERQVRIHRPHRAADLVDERRSIPRAGCGSRTPASAATERLVAFELAPSASARTRSSAPSCPRPRRARRRRRRRLRARRRSGSRGCACRSRPTARCHSSRARFSRHHRDRPLARRRPSQVKSRPATSVLPIVFSRPGDMNLNKRIGGICASA